jgi:hypothetical protein
VGVTEHVEIPVEEASLIRRQSELRENVEANEYGPISLTDDPDVSVAACDNGPVTAKAW